MWRRFSSFLVMLCVVQLIGGHWAALQSLAWLEMVISYSQQETFSQALEKTFDGQHPCKICKFVKKGHAEEESQEVAKSIVQLEAVLAPAVSLPAPEAQSLAYDGATHRHPPRTGPPPLRPPIA